MAWPFTGGKYDLSEGIKANYRALARPKTAVTNVWNRIKDQGFQASDLAPQTMFHPTSAEAAAPQHGEGIDFTRVDLNSLTQGSPVTGDQYTTDGSGGSGVNSAAQEAEFQKALEAKERARGQYTDTFNRTKERQAEINAYGEDQYNTAVARAGEKKGELGKAYGEARTQMGEQLGTTKNALTSAYSARGLGDSSFSNKAQAEADVAFEKNLKSLNEDEAKQVKDVDNYLSDLSKQRQFQLKEISWQDFDTAEQYQTAIEDLNREVQDIEDKRSAYRQSVAQYASSVGSVQSQQATSMLNFAGDITGIYKSALPMADKKTLMKNVVLQAGSKNPDRDADAYLKYLNYSDQLTNSMNPDEDMKRYDDLMSTQYGGWRPFGTQ